MESKTGKMNTLNDGGVKYEMGTAGILLVAFILFIVGVFGFVEVKSKKT